MVFIVMSDDCKFLNWRILSVHPEKMSERSTELTIWLSSQTMGKSSRRGDWGKWEENLRVKQKGKWEEIGILSLGQDSDQLLLMQWEITIWPTLPGLTASMDNKNTKTILYPIYFHRFSWHSNKGENLMILEWLWGNRRRGFLYVEEESRKWDRCASQDRWGSKLCFKREMPKRNGSKI